MKQCNHEIDVYSVSKFKDYDGTVWRVTGTVDYRVFGFFFNVVNKYGEEKQVTESFIKSGYDHE